MYTGKAVHFSGSVVVRRTVKTERGTRIVSGMTREEAEKIYRNAFGWQIPKDLGTMVSFLVINGYLTKEEAEEVMICA